jgi:hypothetical protein
MPKSQGIQSVAQSEIQPSALKIDRLLSRIKDGDVKIPAFQRGFVWTQEQIIDLLDSIYKNYPVGSILFWSSNDRLRSSRNIGGLKLPDRDPEYPVNYVLDGQQRLSTIYAIFATEREFEKETGQHSVDPELFNISFRFHDEAFIPTAEIGDDAGSIQLSTLFDTDDFFDKLDKLSPENKRAARDLYSRFNNYEIPIVTVSRRSKDDVGVIFERINSTGTKLSTLDLLIAWTWNEDFHLQESLNTLHEFLESKGFTDLPDKIVLQCLGAILQNSTKTKTILALSPTEVRSKFEEIQTAIGRAVDFLSTELCVNTLDFMPHLQQLVPLSFFFHHTVWPSHEQVDVLRKWFWKTSFSKRYSAQTDDKMNADILFMTEILSDNYSGLDKYVVASDAAVLLRQKFSKSNPYARAFLLLMAQNNPLDLTNGTRVDLGEALTAYNIREYHHVFPRAFLKQRGVPPDKINSLCNFCFLPSGSNKRISHKEPSNYMFNIVPQGKRETILESNMLPLRLEVYENNDYDTFLRLRAQYISHYVDKIVV